MRRNVRFILFLSCLLAVVLAGCGGSSKVLNSLKTASSKTAGKGRATVHMKWPQRSKSTSRLIPQAANSVKVVIFNGSTQVASTVLVRPAISDPTTSTYDFTDLAPGTYSAVATAYPTTDGTGVGQAATTQNLTIVNAQTTSLNMTMATTIASLQVTGAGGRTSVSTGLPLQLTTTARDVTGNVVLTTPAAIQWSSSDTTKVTVDSTGLASRSATGPVTITAADTESGVSGTLILRPGQIYFTSYGGSVTRMDDMIGTNKITYNTGLGSPGQVYVDANGKIYIAGYSGNTLTRMDDMAGTNKITYNTGSGSNPYGIYVDSSGKIYFTSSTAHTLNRMDDMTGTNLITYNTGLNFPAGLCVDASGKIYIANYANPANASVIRIDDMTGANRVTYNTGLNYPVTVCLDAANRLYIANGNGANVCRLNDMTGTNLITYSTGLSNPYGVFADVNGQIYILDRATNTLTRMDDMTGTNLVTYNTGISSVNAVFVY